MILACARIYRMDLLKPRPFPVEQLPATPRGGSGPLPDGASRQGSARSSKGASPTASPRRASLKRASSGDGGA